MRGPGDTIDTDLGSLEVDLVRTVVDTMIGPLVEADGGTVEIISVHDHQVALRLGGACVGCPARTITRDDVLTPLLTRAMGIPIHVELV